MKNYLDDISKLQKTIKDKEDHLEYLRKSSPYQSQLYINYNKDLFDKIKSNQLQKYNSDELKSQMNYKLEAKQKELSLKQQEVQARLQDLIKQREENLKKGYESFSRAREYKSDLDTQKHLNSCIKSEKNNEIRSDVPKATEYPIQSFSPIPVMMNSRTFFTKKAPKTMFYNPITGDLQDTSNYLYGRYSTKPINKETDSLILPHFKNVNRIVPEFSSLKAFQQPKYTKSHPKYTPSFPITGFSSLNSLDSFQKVRNSQKVFTNNRKLGINY
jgi:hypothetical protein